MVQSRSYILQMLENDDNCELGNDVSTGMQNKRKSDVLVRSNPVFGFHKRSTKVIHSSKFMILFKYWFYCSLLKSLS